MMHMQASVMEVQGVGITYTFSLASPGRHLQHAAERPVLHHNRTGSTSGPGSTSGTGGTQGLRADARRQRRRGLQAGGAEEASSGDACFMQVEVSKESSTGGHKVKVVGLSLGLTANDVKHATSASINQFGHIGESQN